MKQEFNTKNPAMAREAFYEAWDTRRPFSMVIYSWERREEEKKQQKWTKVYQK